MFRWVFSKKTYTFITVNIWDQGASSVFSMRKQSKEFLDDIQLAFDIE